MTDRFFVDRRVDCVAVRDTKWSTNGAGLHHYTPGVLWFATPDSDNTLDELEYLAGLVADNLNRQQRVWDAPRVKRYNIDEAISWETDGCLRDELADRAEDDLGVGDEEGTIKVTVEGDEFVCTFRPAPHGPSAPPPPPEA